MHNPDKMLKELPNEILAAAAGKPNYLRQYDVAMFRFKKYMETKTCPLLPDMQDPGMSKIAYFSAEYGLHRSLPFMLAITSKNAVT